jgi:hypothetical protein
MQGLLPKPRAQFQVHFPALHTVRSESQFELTIARQYGAVQKKLEELEKLMKP